MHINQVSTFSLSSFISFYCFIINIGKPAIFEPWPSLEDSTRLICWIRPQAFTRLDFTTVFFFTEQGPRQTCVEPPIWRPKSLCLCPLVTEMLNYTPQTRVPFPWPSTTRRANYGGVLTLLHREYIVIPTSESSNQSPSSYFPPKTLYEFLCPRLCATCSVYFIPIYDL